MRNLFVAFALSSLTLPAVAAPPSIFQATSAEKASGFRSMAECEAALGLPARHRTKAGAAGNMVRGSVFNRAAGNISRCEMVAGEPVMVVYPTLHRVRAGR